MAIFMTGAPLAGAEMLRVLLFFDVLPPPLAAFCGIACLPIAICVAPKLQKARQALGATVEARASQQIFVPASTVIRDEAIQGLDDQIHRPPVPQPAPRFVFPRTLVLQHHRHKHPAQPQPNCLDRPFALGDGV